MYLINAKTYRLEYFMDSDIPLYAILSHTWGPGEEVTFQDMQDTNGVGLGKPSFSKIRFTCEQALADNLQYAWVDTCTSKGKINNESLQELIAPSDLRFYDRNLALISSRQALTSQLSAITGVHVDVLDWSSQRDPDEDSDEDSDEDDQIVQSTLEILQRVLRTFSIADRMAWAAARRTSRLEDIGYSSLGIFDVNMPMLYGEGNRAFMRLQQETIRTSKDHSIFAWEDQASDSEFRPYGNLAGHPSQFRLAIAQGRSAGAYWPRYSDAGFDLTNEGLRLTVPIVSNFNGMSWAVLHCGVSNDLTGPLAIPLLESLDKPPLYTICSPGGKRFISTIPLELVHGAETKTIVMQSSSVAGWSEKCTRTVSFRTNVLNESRPAKILAAWPSGHCERSFAIRVPYLEDAPPNKAPQDLTISLPSVNGRASGVRIWTAMSKIAPDLFEPEAKTSSTGHRVWNVAFCFRAELHPRPRNNLLLYEAWVAPSEHNVKVQRRRQPPEG
ncbi:hypothetical protein LTS10_012571 [Elasticomyces elasticus]|nr:hypothetical protein LTS10_012571 [Elasticomyces elasticus]